MYTHAYSDYVQHILNKSPSKATYTFTKTERFPQQKTEAYMNEPFLQANGFEYRDGAKTFTFSPLKSSENERINAIKKRETQGRAEPKYINAQEGRKTSGYSPSKSKSPLRPQISTSQHQLSRQERRHGQRKQNTYRKQEFMEKYSPSQLKTFKKSASKSPNKSTDRVSYSPNTTYKQLHDIDHVSKNITLNGYYPTGYELSPNGNYPVSKLRNAPAHSFGRSSSELRYNYMVKSDDTLGPGYYEQFSQFGQPRK